MILRLILTSVLFALFFQLHLLSFQASEAAPRLQTGDWIRFSTKGHPKAKGANFTMAYPADWSAAEGDRPNIVHKFISEDGRGLEVVLIVTEEMHLPPGMIPTKEDLQEFFAPSNLREMLPDSAILVEARSTEIEGIPAGTLEYILRTERAGMSLLIQAWTLNFIYDRTFVGVQFQVTALSGREDDLAHRMATFRPLFFMMANSITFPDKWTSSAGTPTRPSTNPQPGSGPLGVHSEQFLIPGLLASLAVSLGIALVPPLLIRYVFVGRPLSKKSATWIAVGLSASFWLTALLISRALGENPGTGAAPFIAFFVARWIMSRGGAPTAAPTLPPPRPAP